MMQNYYIIIGVVIFVLVVGFVAMPYAKTKGWLSRKIASHFATKVDSGINIVQAVIRAIELKNVNVKAMSAVLDIADIATDFVVLVIESEDNNEKVKISRGVVYKVFDELGITPTEAQHNLIDIVIKEGVEFLQNK
jgi:hypothetical protein